MSSINVLYVCCKWSKLNTFVTRYVFASDSDKSHFIERYIYQRLSFLGLKVSVLAATEESKRIG